METQITEAKYIFMDIVGYSYKRSVEAETHIIAVMNSIVKETLNFFNISESSRILVPTGDGICIALLDLKEPFDIHIKIALEVLRLLNKSNQTTLDIQRQFDIRIGINENTDNLIIDINNNRNIAGAGINEAQRIMDQGSPNQIFVGRSVYDRLKQRESYEDKFRFYKVLIKHNITYEIYQYINPSIIYLNSDEPKKIKQVENYSHNRKFSKLLAYFMAHTVKNRDFIMSTAGSARNNLTLFTLFSFLAKDSLEKSEFGNISEHNSIMPAGTIIEQFEYFQTSYFDLLMDYSAFFFEIHIYPFAGGSIDKPLKYFYDGSFCLVPSEEALTKLKQEYPEIIQEFQI